jgi:hypothetical protein
MQLLKKHPIIILLVIAFLIGVMTLPARGEGWDEFLLHRYATRSLSAYQTWLTEGKTNLTLANLGAYGPAYSMFNTLSFRLLDPILPGHPNDIYHLVNLLTYLAGIWAFYDLARRWMPRLSAVGATVLLLTQPVFWGHAFMNPKDIPLFSFFLLSVAFGLRMNDSFEPLSITAPTDRTRRILSIFTIVWLVSIFGLFLSTNLIHTVIANSVLSAASGQNNLISLVASHIRTAPSESYIQKFFLLFLQVQAAYAFVSTLLLIYLYYRYSRATLRAVLPILVPAILLGFTASVRILGPFAGVLVAVHALYTKGKKAIPVLILYALLAIITMYLTWPYLWENPVGHFVESIVRMSAYPWDGEVLFNGMRYKPTELPYSYLPVLLGIQLTEPVWLLFLAGLIVTIMGARKGQDDKKILLGLVLLWLILPLIGLIILHPPLYDNFRQVLFIIPPVFLMAGIAFSMIKHARWQAMLIVLVLLPGMINGVRLYPYEYIYYNRFVGGVHGALRRFELDYWGTTYREAAEYVNSIASPNSYVWVEGPAHLFEPYSRKDLKVLDAFDPDLAGKEYYLVTLSRYDFDLLIAPEAKTIFTISRDGAPLAVVKKP